MIGNRSRLFVLAAAAVLGLAGCGSDATAPATSTPTTTPTTTAPAAATEHGGLAHCLGEHGVTESTVSPAGPPPGVDQDTWDKAIQACSALAPGPGPAPGP